MNIFKKILSKGQQTVIILRGAPSTGKTTVAHLLTERIPGLVKISVDSLVNMNVKPKHTNEEWVKGRPLGLEMARVLLEYFLTKGNCVVIEEFFIETNRIKEIIKISRKHKASSYVFELTVSLMAALEREKIRPDAKNEKPVEELIGLMEKNPYVGTIQIDTSDKSPNNIVDLILQNLKRN